MTRRRLSMLLLSAALLATLPVVAIPAQAQQREPRRVDQKVKAEPGKTTRIAVFANVKADCSAGPLPTIRLAEPPAGGTVTIRQAKIRITNYKSCLAAEVPAYVAFYRPKPDFSGTDAVTLEVKNDKGEVVQIRKITITITAGTQAL